MYPYRKDKLAFQESYLYTHLFITKGSVLFVACFMVTAYEGVSVNVVLFGCQDGSVMTQSVGVS